MQQAGGDGDRVHHHFGQHQRHLQGMHQIRLAGGAALSGVMFQRKFVGLLDDFQIVVGTVAAASASSARGIW